MLYQGTGDHAHLETARDLSDPIINISSIRDLDSEDFNAYNWTLNNALYWASVPADPALFPKTSEGLIDYTGKPHFLGPFFHVPVSRWPSLYSDLHIITAFRDEDLAEPPPDPFLQCADEDSETETKETPHDPVPQ